ncbi:PREDICTED: prostaglandin E synthase 3-like isoform X1 [Branchiostoma belcheri]|uniref:Prostaglandin E synthase 3-like isoform X1 n=1 Tax=Branchiostoma belcheri TaxID=7741 RepID=A0A6P4ZPW8_BRABE|nr:PREDICTED: prostaglandin E synthase 3-like isoform X1 [Branchiostoma belcheri]
MGKEGEIIQDDQPVAPAVYWAQRDDVLILTIQVEDIDRDKNRKVTLNEKSLSFSGKGGAENKDYHCDIKFFKEVNVEDSKYNATARGLKFLIKKKEKGPYWTRLTEDKVKLHWLRTDFSYWKDEDDSDDEDQQRDANLEKLMAQMGESGGGLGDGDAPSMDDLDDEKDSDDEELPDLE